MARFKSLYWKISSVFLILMVVVGGVYVYVTATAASDFFKTTKQKLNREVAGELLNDVPVFLNDSLNENAVKRIMDHHMEVNPTIEVYVLDKDGKILTYDAPPEKIKKSHVSLVPIREFLKGEETADYILGNDPKAPDACKVFSVAPVIDGEDTKGYVYAILASEKYDDVSTMLMSNFMYKVGVETFIITVIFAIIIGLISIRYLTRNFKVIEDGVARFRSGDYNNQIELKSQGEFTHLADCLNEMATTISENIDQLKSIEKLRKELVANVSHDLRTPIAITHGYIETLLMKNNTMNAEDRERFLKIVLNSTENLEKLVADLFELSKLESEKVELKLEEISLCEFAHDISNRYKILAEKKGVDFEVNASEMGTVKVDVALMERVIQNLVDNAIKFTPQGGTVAVDIVKNKGAFQVSISDTGIGIGEQSLPFVFDRYKKLDSDSKNDTGAGLGLAIVKRILELHGIEISVSSSKDEGTKFFFEIKKAA